MENFGDFIMNGNYKKCRPTRVACYVGYIVQAIVNNFLPILFIVFQKEYGLSYEKLGRLILINFATQIFADSITPKIISAIGYKKTAILCQGGAAVGLLMAGILPQVLPNVYLALVAALLVYSFSSGLMEVVLSPMIEMLPTGNKSGNMSLLHSFYCWGQAFTVVVTTALVYIFGYGKWQFIPIIWAILPAINTVCFLYVPVVEPPAEVKQDTLSELIKSRRFRCFMVMMLCAGASELAMSQWASMFAQNGLGVSKVVGDLAGPCAFALCMGLGRVVYAAFSDRISFRRTMIAMSVACFVCYIVVGLCNVAVLSLIACAICGFTVSLSWPGTYSAGSAAFPNGGAVMFSVFALCGDLGCSFGPWLLGIVADNSSLNVGFLVSAAAPLIMIITALFFLKEKDFQN